MNKELQDLLREDVITALTHEISLVRHNYNFNDEYNDEFQHVFEDITYKIDVNKLAMDYGLITDSGEDVQKAIDSITVDDINWEEVF